MNKKQCERFKCTYEPAAPDCDHCQFDAVCPFSDSCVSCLYGMASDFVYCPEKPLSNFEREKPLERVESRCGGK